MMQTDLANFGYLETIGKFVGTYGLAVFLVLYYAVRLYPEMQRERGDWIRQITRLRQLVDPGTRPLTRDQAKTVMQLASDALVDRWLFILEIRGRMSTGYFPSPTFTSEPGLVTHSFFGKELSFNTDAEMSVDQRAKELDKLVAEIDRAVKDQMRAYRDNLDDCLKQASEMARRDSYRLALLRFGATSLEAVWTKANEESVKQWSEGLQKSLDASLRYELDRVREFVNKHPSTSGARDKLDTLFAEIRFVNGQEHASKFKTLFDKNVDEELRRIDESSADEV